ncbi:MAG: sensor domain-containing diguanylate cyclase [Candidatus Omnitrophica bacterium]|nr:sensor domain-containing diguanylate cyclase [Candidatus Omnitrophota bacterium]
MAWIRILVWSLFIVILFGIASIVVPRIHFTDQLLTVFLQSMSWLPPRMSFEAFLVTGLLTCLLIAALMVAVTVTHWLGIHGAWLLVKSKQHAREAEAHHRAQQLQDQAKQEYQFLTALSVDLTQRLEKRTILQNILVAASRITTLARCESAVAVWRLDFETECMRFELGSRCDESIFAKQSVSIVEPPFAKLIATKQPLSFADWHQAAPFVTPDKASRLSDTRGLLLVPLIIEHTVLGCLSIFCHPDLIKQAEARANFYQAVWGQCALALAIAIQGELAILDRLTGVVNQGYFLKRLGEEIERSNRYELSLGLLMIDIDNFKAVNDSLGHPQGDATLRIVSKLIKKEARVVDLVGRYGGEEFIVMLPETGFSDEHAEVSGAITIAERIRKAIEEEFHDLQKPLAITVSIGVAVRRHPQDRHVDGRELIRIADEQLYKAKTSGKNKCCVHMPATPERVL